MGKICCGVPPSLARHSRLCLAPVLITAAALAANVADPRDVRAQQGTSVSQLDGRVSTFLKQRVESITDSAAAEGLPTGPLIDKALEGASKHADESRIISAVRLMIMDLRRARHALGASASEDELTAGVAALRAGMAPSALAKLRRLLPRRTLTVPLSVLAALVIDGAPPALATDAVVDNAMRGDDRHLLDFGRAVARSLAGGVPAQIAFSTRTAPTGKDPGAHAPAKPPKP